MGSLLQGLEGTAVSAQAQVSQLRGTSDSAWPVRGIRRRSPLSPPASGAQPRISFPSLRRASIARCPMVSSAFASLLALLGVVGKGVLGNTPFGAARDPTLFQGTKGLWSSSLNKTTLLSSTVDISFS